MNPTHRFRLAGLILVVASLGTATSHYPSAAQTVIFTEGFDAPWLTASFDLQTPPLGYWSSIGTGDMACHRIGYVAGWTGTAGLYSPPGALGTPQSACWNTRNAPIGSVGSIRTPYFPIYSFPGPKTLTFYKIGSDSLRVSITYDGVAYQPVMAVGTVSTWTRFDANLGPSGFSAMAVRFEAVARHGPIDVGVDEVTVAGGSVNRPPVVQPIPGQQIPEDQLLIVPPIGGDPDGDPIIWSGANLPAGATVDPGSGALWWKPCLDQEGPYPGVTLIASDPSHATGSASFTITVTHPDVTQYGSCAFSDGTCLTLTQAQCTAENGAFQGGGTFCADGAAAQDKEKWIVIPVKVNVLKPIDFSKDKAKEMIDAANKILKQAKIKFEFDAEKNYQSGVSDGGAGAEKDDGKIAKSEEGGLFKNGTDELKKKAADGGFDGKGFKIYVTTGFGANPARQGYNVHKTPVGMVRDLETGTMGEIIAHEFSHAMTLAKKAAYNDAGDLSDDKGHVDDPENLMYEEPNHSHNGPKLEGPQIKEITKPENAAARGDTKEMKSGQGPQERVATAPFLERLAIHSGLWTDSLTDAGHPGVDLAGGQLMIDDPAVHLAVRMRVDGFLPDSIADTLSYQVAFDTDHRPDTGIPWGSFTGIDKVLDVRVTGHAPYSWTNDNLHARLLDAATGNWECLPPGGLTHEYAISDVNMAGTSSADSNSDMIEQPIRLASLGFSANTVTYGVRAEERNAGGIVAVDEGEPEELLLGPPAGPRLDMTPLTAAVGEPAMLAGSGFSPSSPISIFVDDRLMAQTMADASGSFAAPLTAPNLPDGPYFVTARDTSGAFDFSVLTVSGGSVAAPDAPLAAVQLAIERNPFQKSVAFSLPGEGRGSLAIVDVGGRLVRRLDVPTQGPDSRRIVWNGKTASGLDAPCGVYFVRLLRGPVRAGARLVKVF